MDCFYCSQPPYSSLQCTQKVSCCVESELWMLDYLTSYYQSDIAKVFLFSKQCYAEWVCILGWFLLRLCLTSFCSESSCILHVDAPLMASGPHACTSSWLTSPVLSKHPALLPVFWGAVFWIACFPPPSCPILNDLFPLTLPSCFLTSSVVFLLETARKYLVLMFH